MALFLFQLLADINDTQNVNYSMILNVVPKQSLQNHSIM